MNFKSIFKPLSIALLVVGMSQAAFAMEKSEANKKLLEASFKGTLAEVQEALEKGANINHSDTGPTPLHAAVLNNRVEIAKLLVNQGADVNCPNNYGYTPLHYACRRNCVIEIAKLLINHGADVNTANNKQTPLHIVSWNNRPEIVELLLNHGANVNSANHNNNTPLHLASIKNHPKVAKLLLEHGADINLANKDGETALDIAKQLKHPEIIELITNEAKRQEKAKQEEFKDLCNKRLLEHWNRNKAQTSDNNVKALILFTNRDKQQKIELKNPDLAQAAQIAKTNQSVFDWFLSVLSDFSG